MMMDFRMKVFGIRVFLDAVKVGAEVGIFLGMWRLRQQSPTRLRSHPFGRGRLRREVLGC